MLDGPALTRFRRRQVAQRLEDEAQVDLHVGIAGQQLGGLACRRQGFAIASLLLEHDAEQLPAEAVPGKSLRQRLRDRLQFDQAPLMEQIEGLANDLLAGLGGGNAEPGGQLVHLGARQAPL